MAPIDCKPTPEDFWVAETLGELGESELLKRLAERAFIVSDQAHGRNRRWRRRRRRRMCWGWTRQQHGAGHPVVGYLAAAARDEL